MSPRLSALRLSLAYLAIAIAWAFLSDHLLQNQVQDHDQLVFWMTAKRLFFFAATGLLLYLYLVRQFRRKAQAYDELHGSEQRLNRALEAVRDGLWDWDLVTDRMFVSPGYAALIGLAPEELGDPIETWKKRLHPEEYATVLEAHRNHLQGLTDNLDHIYRLRHKDGDYRWIHSRGRVLRDAPGQAAAPHWRGPRHHPAAAQGRPPAPGRGGIRQHPRGRSGHRCPGGDRARQPFLRAHHRLPPEDVLGKTPAILRSGRQDQAFYQRLAGPARAGRLERRNLEPAQERRDLPAVAAHPRGAQRPGPADPLRRGVLRPEQHQALGERAGLPRPPRLADRPAQPRCASASSRRWRTARTGRWPGPCC